MPPRYDGVRFLFEESQGERMIIAAIAFGEESIGISVLERVYPEKTLKLLVDRVKPEKHETDQTWYARAFGWTAGILRQHRPSAVLVEGLTKGEQASAARGVALAATSQYGSVVVSYEMFGHSLKAISRATGSKDAARHVRRSLKLNGYTSPEIVRGCAMALARLVVIPGERLKAEAFEFEKTERYVKRGGKVFA